MDRQEIAIMAAIIVAIALIVLVRQHETTPEGFEIANVAVDGMYITLTSGCSQLGIEASPWQIDAITSGVGYRPGTHDLFTDALAGLDANVSMVLIDAEEYGTYYARLIINGKRTLNLDARPDDAIAMAMRSGAPVYVSISLLKKDGKNVCNGKDA